MWQGSKDIMRELTRLLRVESDGKTLLGVGLLITALEDQIPDIAGAESFMNGQAERVRALVAGSTAPADWIAALNEIFFRQCGFTGSPAGNYEPAFSDLSQVLGKRTGIPISLSVLYLEMGWRAGLPLVGINFPGHFLVGLDTRGEILPIDVHEGGRLLTEADCQERLLKVYGDSLRFDRGMLHPASQRAIWVRMLNNLKGFFIQSGKQDRAVEMIDRILLVDPRRYTEFRDRGLLQHYAGRKREAAADLQQYLHFVPEAPDAPMIRSLLKEILETCPPLH
ncbi:transglutaminase-like domain-containing protein [Thermithiobacillus plumbiphilus]|uniref:Transglutaminase-like domain-containing protein n=1 Tax=Thermithiobacillus plumbiphilus TaxID=1729899 RepID=A0ABU9DBX1_9PROT